MAFISKQWDDEAFLQGIAAGGSVATRHENNFYEHFSHMIREAVRKHRLSEEDASMAYSDAVLTVFDNVRNGKFERGSLLRTYLYRIFSNKCVDLLRKNTTNTTTGFEARSLDDLLVPIPDTTRSILQELIRQVDHQRLYQVMQELGEKCRQLLWGWGEGYTDRELAASLNYSSVAVAKTSRNRCMERLKSSYKDSS